MRVLFITNFCPHYRVRTFELLAQRLDIHFVFFSTGHEWYWERRHGIRFGAFPWRMVRPGQLGVDVWRADAEVIIKDIDGPLSVLLSFVAAKMRRKPFVLWTGMWRHPRTLFHLLTYPFTRLLYRWADAIVVYGEHVRRYLTSLGVQPDKVFVAPHALDNEAYARSVSASERAALRTRFGLGDGPVVLFVGRLEAVKGPGILLKAFSRLSGRARLVFVGRGSLRAELECQVEQLGVQERVVFADYQVPEDTVTWYAAADLLVLPSVTVNSGRETWGLVVNEAMNQGIPVVASTAVGAAAGGLVRHDFNGLIVPEGDVAALASELSRLLGDPTLRRRLGERARDSVTQWSNDRMVAGFVSALEYAQSLDGR